MSKATKKPAARAVTRNAGSGQCVVKHVTGTIQPAADRWRLHGVNVKSSKLQNLPTRPTSLSRLKEISLRYGVALDRLAKR